jgi:ribonuclease I
VQDNRGDLLRISWHPGVCEGERRKKAAERQQTCDDQRNDRFFHKRYSLSVYRVYICAI